MAPDVTCGAFAVCPRYQNGHFDTGSPFTCQTRFSKHRCGVFDGTLLHRGALNIRISVTFQRNVSFSGAGVTYFFAGDILNCLSMHKSASFCVADTFYQLLFERQTGEIRRVMFLPSSQARRCEIPHNKRSPSPTCCPDTVA